MREPAPPYRIYQYEYIAYWGEYHDERTFHNGLAKFINENKIYVERYIMESNHRICNTETSQGRVTYFEFIARQRTEDDDLREQIEFMIENING